MADGLNDTGNPVSFAEASQAALADLGNTPPEAGVSGEATGVAPAETPQAPEPSQGLDPKSFGYDATKLPAELQPAYRDMQSAWTKKIEEIQPYRDLAEQYGSVEEIGDFLSQFQTPEGIIDWWAAVADQLGIDQDSVSRLLSGEPVGAEPLPGEQTFTDPAAQPGPQVVPPNVLTKEEFAQWQREQQVEQQATAEQHEVKSLLEELQVPTEVRDLVMQQSARYPYHLGYRERLTRGFADFKKLVDSQIATSTPSPVPSQLNGQVPSAGPQRFASIEEATAALKAGGGPI